MKSIKSGSTRFAAIMVMAGAVFATGATHAAECPEVLPEPVGVNLGIRTVSLASIGVNLALEKGYFKDLGLDITLTDFPGAANPHIPALANGDLDVIFSGTSASLFNTQPGGFDVKLWLPAAGHAEGFASQVTIVAKPELVESGAMDDPEQVKKLRLDGLVPGSVAAYTFQRLLEKMDAADGAELTYRTPASPTDMVSLFKRGEVDASAMIPPLDVLMEKDGTAKIWKTSYDALGEVTFGFLLGNPTFLEEKHCAAVAFARAYRKAAAEVMASGGEWTPELLALAAKTANLPEDLILATNVPHHVVSGTIDMPSLEDQLAYYEAAGLIIGDVDLNVMVDTSVVKELGE